ncbi:MAG TPA: hypothetical protein VEJ87_14060 [Acidimicrobiales bacterium]|nr:hypothetical protein [Acidimicrobiales bacterium]
MSTGAGTVLTVVVLSAAGTLPVLALVGFRWPSVPLAPLGGALLAAISAIPFLVVGGSPIGWFVALTLLCAIGTLAVWAKKPELRPARRVPNRRPLQVAIAAFAIGATAASALRSLSNPSIGFDTRMIWFLRAGWFLQSRHQALADIRNPGLGPTHASYPPLVSMVVALAWRLTGTHSDRLGVVVIALLNVCALAATGWFVVEAGRRLAHDTRAPALVFWSSVAVGISLILIAAGVTSPFFTNGYADPLWSLAAVGAVGYGLVLPRASSNVAIAGLLAGVAAFTKVEGTAVAAVVVVLVTVRVLWSDREHLRGGVALGLLGLASVSVWSLVMRLLHASADVNTSGVALGSLTQRTRSTFDAAAPYLHVLELAAVVSLVAFLALRIDRRRAGLGSDGWTWAVLAAAVTMLGIAYVTGPGNIEFWLVSSIHRTTMYPALQAWWIVAICGLVRLAAFLGPAGEDLNAKDTDKEDDAFAKDTGAKHTGAHSPSEDLPRVGSEDPVPYAGTP